MTNTCLNKNTEVLRCLHGSEEIRLSLTARGYDSAVRIYGKTKKGFAEDVADILSAQEAEHVWERAAQTYTMLTHIVAALNGSNATPSVGPMKAQRSAVTGKRMFENIPNYQKIFKSSLDYCTCPKCKSVFGPAAYMVDLLRLIEKYIELDRDENSSGRAISLRERRPDLFSMKLTCENTNTEMPYLEIVNRILEQFLGGEKLYKELAFSCYPAVLPFYLPLEKLEAWLKLSDTGLGVVLEILKAPCRLVNSALLGILPKEYDLLASPLSNEDLARFCGQDILNPAAMSDINPLLYVLQLERGRLQEALTQDIGEAEQEKTERLLHGLFINQGLENGEYLKIDGDIVKNITTSSLERLLRFVRLSARLELSYDELDWLLKTAGADEQGNILMDEVVAAVRLAKAAGLGIYTVCALAGRIKDYGSNPFSRIFGRTRRQLDTLCTDAVSRRRVAAKAAGIDADSADVIGAALTEEKSGFDELYRHCLLARLLGMSGEEYTLFVRLTLEKFPALLTFSDIRALLHARTDTCLNAYETDFLVHHTESPYARSSFSRESFRDALPLLRAGAPGNGEGEEAAEDLAEYVYTKMGQFFGLDASQTARLMTVMLGEEAAGWPQRMLVYHDYDALYEEIKPAGGYCLLLQKGICLELLETAAECSASFGIESICSLRAGNISDLEAYQRMMDQPEGDGEKLLAFVKGFEGGNPDYDLLAQALGWETRAVEDTVLLLYPQGVQNEQNIRKFVETLGRCLSLRKHLGLDSGGMRTLSSCREFTAEGYDEALARVDALCAPVMTDALHAAICAQRRNALLVLALDKLRKTYADMTDYNKLYKYFLIDVEMDDKTRISPVKEGLNALQLYLQRCRMRLETGILELSIPESWWSWIMDYRMWEANRRIFVYPENYLTPTIRHTRTSLYKNVEEALQQSKITEGYIEEKYEEYLDDYDQLTQLKICGAYETQEDFQDVLYVFARTQQTPCTYYYCRRVGALSFSEWQKVDTNIDSTNITPVYVFNRLYLFWSSVRESTKVKVAGGATLLADNQRAYSLAVKYTFLNLQGKWITPQTLSEDVVVYAVDDNDAMEKMRERAKMLGLDPEDGSFDRLTLLRLKQKNLGGFVQKGKDYECLAVITGSFSHNLGKELSQLENDNTLDREQEAFADLLSRLTSNNNFAVQDRGDGYFSTGFFRIYNQDLEEDHFLHGNEFIVVDGYIPQNGSRIYTQAYDEIHRAVGIYLSQAVLRDAVRPNREILPYRNNGGNGLVPVLGENAFVASVAEDDEKESRRSVISEAMSRDIYLALRRERILSSAGQVNERVLSQKDLSSILSDVMYDSQYGAVTERDIVERNNRILPIQKLLYENAGAVYLFDSVDKAQIIPVINQPGKFIFDCGEEVFLVYPVYEKEGKYTAVNFRQADAGVTAGAPVTYGMFFKMGIEVNTARDMVTALKKAGILTGDGIINRAACTRNSIGFTFPDLSVEMADQVYARLLNLPVISKETLGAVKEIGADDIIHTLQKGEEKILYSYMDGQGKSDSRYYIDLDVLKKQNGVSFTTQAGTPLEEKSVRKIYRQLQSACSAVYLYYHGADDLPELFTGLPFKDWKFGVQRLTNPTIKKMRRKIEVGGIRSFLNRKTQEAPREPVLPFSRLGPSQNVVQPKALDGAQVDFEGLYQEYNWELFYHLPITIAGCLNTAGMYEESMEWFHYIFNPAAEPDENIEKYYWNFLPFTCSDSETMEMMLKDTTALRAYNDSPFDPHAIARLRIDAYAKYTVMQYVENLIQWGDSQFLLNTWEALTIATMLYVRARDLLGPKPQPVGVFRRGEERSFDEIEAYFADDPEGIPQFLYDLEKELASSGQLMEWFPLNEKTPFNDVRSYFGVPQNEQFFRMWDVIDDRLYKIRNSLDLNGAPRTTALFDSPYNPAAIARAAAAGAGEALMPLTRRAALYPYRFSYMIDQAKAMTEQVSRLGESLLAALEKGDAESLMLLTGAQERTILQMTTKIRECQEREQEAAVEALKVSREAAQKRMDYYKHLADENMSGTEIAAFALLSASAGLEACSGSLQFASGVTHLVPEVGSPFAMTFGGLELGLSFKGAAAGYHTLSGIVAHAAQQTLTMAQYERRRQEWEQQRDQAEKEIDSLDKQISAAGERLAAAKREKEIHLRSIEYRDSVLAFFKSKFSCKQLYQWLSGRLSTTLRQTYQLALSLALSAQEAYRYERDENDSFLTMDYWDSGRRGLMAGDGLMLALHTMQQSYQRNNTRRMEIEKHISLRGICPEAIEQIQENGICEFSLSEELFARDYPGCYSRRISHIAVSVPAVLPPYETIRAVLRQRNSRILVKPDMKGIDYLFGITTEAPEETIVRDAGRRGEKIAISKGIDDSGLFQLQFTDERYLPFEGTGVNSNWILEMPRETNRFSFDTITDIIVTVSYTALEDEQRGEGSFYAKVMGRLKK